MVRLVIVSVVALMCLPYGMAYTAEAEETDRSQVTTDTLAYCQELSRRVAEHEPDPATLAGRLAKDGRELCLGGHARSGITMLRRSLALRADTVSLTPQ